MNAPHAPSDPLLQSLAEDAADLPGRAAALARQRTAQRRQTRQSLAFVSVVSLLGISTWVLFPPPDRQPGFIATHPVPGGDAPILAKNNHSPEPDAPLAPFPMETVKPQPGIVKVTAPPPLPTGLNEEQTEFVNALPDVPLLFVRDDSGKVTRIHVVRR